MACPSIAADQHFRERQLNVRCQTGIHDGGLVCLSLPAMSQFSFSRPVLYSVCLVAFLFLGRARSWLHRNRVANRATIIAARANKIVGVHSIRGGEGQSPFLSVPLLLCGATTRRARRYVANTSGFLSHWPRMDLCCSAWHAVLVQLCFLLFPTPIVCTAPGPQADLSACRDNM